MLKRQRPSAHAKASIAPVDLPGVDQVIDCRAPPRFQQMVLGKLVVETIGISGIGQKIARELGGLSADQRMTVDLHCFPRAAVVIRPPLSGTISVSRNSSFF